MIMNISLLMLLFLGKSFTQETKLNATIEPACGCIKPFCGKYEQYQIAGTETYCYKGQLKCRVIKKPGCFCQSGYVRNELNQCIPIKKCLDDGCKANDPLTQYYSCGICPKVCPGHPVPICGCSPGCNCIPGTYYDTIQNKCVYPKNCTCYGIVCPVKEIEYT